MWRTRTRFLPQVGRQTLRRLPPFRVLIARLAAAQAALRVQAASSRDSDHGERRLRGFEVKSPD